MSDISHIRALAKDFSILYAEDNNALRQQASSLLKKLFDVVYVAADGEEALTLFKQNHPKIVITDIKMPKLDGMQLSVKIKAIRPEARIIIMSAFDDKEYLFEAIRIGIFRFLKKPVSIASLTSVLVEAIENINKEEQSRIFFSHLNDVFNYQSSLIVMMKENKMILASQRFLDFFGVNSIEDFSENRADLGSCFLKHDGFLYNDGSRDWLSVITANEDKLFHVKMTDNAHKMHHFIFKMHRIPEKPDMTILSFDDISELNLLGLFDNKKSVEESAQANQKAIFDLLEVIERNHAKIKLHNFYRGLSIANDAIVTDTKNSILQLKTNFLQQKAIQIDKRTVITSEALPHDTLCEALYENNFDNQSVAFKSLQFLPRSPVSRKNIRVEPDDKHTVTLFFNEHKFFGDVRIVDISVDAVKISMNALPAGLEENEKVRLDMILTLEKRQVIVNTEAYLFRKYELNRLFYLVFMMESTPQMKRALTEYISKRQMQLIREFKGMQNGK